MVRHALEHPRPATPAHFTLLHGGAHAEELVYRGYMQGRLRVLGPLPAVALAALGHTAYKCALFALPGRMAQVDIGILAVWTFLGGLLETMGTGSGRYAYLSGTGAPLMVGPIWGVTCVVMVKFGYQIRKLASKVYPRESGDP